MLNLIDSFFEKINQKFNVYSKVSELIKRCWLMLLVIVMSLIFVLPSYDFGVISRFFTIFYLAIFCGWVGGRIFYITRSSDVTTTEIIWREGYYTAIICASLFAAATASL